VLAALDLPMLVAVPWVGTDGGNGGLMSRFRKEKDLIEA
jgi:hypothetical protein